ncbi:hypothetical protein EVAR_68595_1 [Eumeta japonica]|uniref:Uncharacterized protein n=1 Tax=Eumeta variegata TaxID=151549 RepID=A0A4C2A5U2_EUMVA|nr:hypothetical protein EVAR_68595_1 [Eumeta japonica]
MDLSDSDSLSNPTTVLSELVVCSSENELGPLLFPLVRDWDLMEFWLEAGVVAWIEARLEAGVVARCSLSRSLIGHLYPSSPRVLIVIYLIRT